MHISLRAAGHTVRLLPFQHGVRFDHVPVVAPVGLGQLGREEVVVGLADDLVWRFAQERAETLVGEGESTREVFGEEIDGHVAHQREIQGLRDAD